MARRTLISYIFLLLGHILVAQQEGDTWVIGYNSPGHPNYSVMHLKFNDDRIRVSLHPDEILNLSAACAVVGNEFGEAVLWTNGMQIFGRHGVKVADTISFGGEKSFYWDYYHAGFNGPFGFPKHTSTLILPIPESYDEYLVLYHTASVDSVLGYFAVSQNLQARVRMWPDTTFEVMYQDSAMNPYHQYYNGDITATRHANGRDWWVITFDIFTPQYYAYLLGPEGIHLHHTGMVDVLIPNGLGQSVFSPLGSYLARVDAISQNQGQYITLMSFDRCTGELVREHSFHTPTGTFTGAAFSSDERYLYADNNRNLWQWDLLAADVSGSQFLVDTFDGFIQPGWFGTRFGPMMQAPDNRIYIVPPAGSSQYLHTIERPDQPGKACRFLQHNINLTKWNSRSAPNVPNYRLGPVDGSPCDTLGIDNHPVARWRYEELNPGYWQEILFTDMSYFDPHTWHWDFDDGTTSSERSPVHTFEPGLYHVCLTVSNDFASDSLCRWVDILSTSLEAPGTDRPSDLTIHPNPFSDALVIRSRSGIFRPVHMQLYNIHGQLVFDQPQAPVPVTIYLPGSIVPGMYFCRIVEEDGMEYGFKLVRR